MATAGSGENNFNNRTVISNSQEPAADTLRTEALKRASGDFLQSLDQLKQISVPPIDITLVELKQETDDKPQVFKTLFEKAKDLLEKEGKFTDEVRKEFEDAIAIHHVPNIHKNMHWHFDQLAHGALIDGDLEIQLSADGRLNLHQLLHNDMSALHHAFSIRQEYADLLYKHGEYSECKKVCLNNIDTAKEIFPDKLLRLLGKEASMIDIHLAAKPDPQKPDDIKHKWECTLSRERQAILQNIRITILGADLSDNGQTVTTNRQALAKICLLIPQRTEEPLISLPIAAKQNAISLLLRIPDDGNDNNLKLARNIQTEIAKAKQYYMQLGIPLHQSIEKKDHLLERMFKQKQGY